MNTVLTEAKSVAEESGISASSFARPQDVLSFLGCTRCRFVFRPKRTKGMEWLDRSIARKSGSAMSLLSYDINNPEPQLLHLPGNKSFAPIISPCGHWIVSSETFKRSPITVINIRTLQTTTVAEGAHPRWWIDPANGSRCIVYREDSDCYRDFPAGKTLRLRINDKGEAAGEPEVLWDWGYNGGLTPDGRYMATGFVSFSVADITEKRQWMPMGPAVEQTGYGQVCSVSMAPDLSRRSLQLRMPHAHVGICDLECRWHLLIRHPDGMEEWQSPEWSTHPDFITASALNPDKNYDIFVVRLTDLHMLRITLDGGYIHGHLWIEGAKKSTAGGVPTFHQ